jgi:hypothetical protein
MKLIIRDLDIGKLIDLEVNGNIKIYELKNIIYSKSRSTNSNIKLLELTFNNVILSDNKYVNDYNIKNDSVVYMTNKNKEDKLINIIIRSEIDKLINLKINHNAKIMEIKEKIQSYCTYNGTPLKYLKLKYNDIYLQDDDNLENNNIKNDSIIYLENTMDKNNVNIMFSTIVGAKFYLEINRKTTFSRIKIALQNINIITDPDYCLLIFAGKKLNNDKTIDFYNLQNGSCIHILHTSHVVD